MHAAAARAGDPVFRILRCHLDPEPACTGDEGEIIERPYDVPCPPERLGTGRRSRAAVPRRLPDIHLSPLGKVSGGEESTPAAGDPDICLEIIGVSRSVAHGPQDLYTLGQGRMCGEGTGAYVLPVRVDGVKRCDGGRSGGKHDRALPDLFQGGCESFGVAGEPRARGIGQIFPPA